MAKKFEVHVEAERYIHNELGQASEWYQDQVQGKCASGDTAGIAIDMTAALVFAAFDIEAKANFVGWKIFGDDWDNRASLKKKINRLANELMQGIGCQPLPARPGR